MVSWALFWGRAVYGVVQRFTIVALVLLVCGLPARSEELVMPFACHADRGDVRLAASNETSYRILGRRDEQAFVMCRSNSSGCTTMMVHRFVIDCDGEKTAWWRVAQAARSLGVDMPSGLPAGFAPVSSLAGRLLLPALAPSASATMKVSMQDLSPNSVTDEADERDERAAPGWVTVVNADIRADGNTGVARVSAAVLSILMVLLAASMIAAGRWRMPAISMVELPGAARTVTSQVYRQSRGLALAIRRRGGELWQTWQRSSDTASDEGLANALAMVHARLAETELAVATLPSDLLLRDVLTSEIDRVRERAAATEKQLRRTSPQKSASAVRAMLRELDRISRIAQSAAYGPARDVRDEPELPRSIGEAYQMLGVNPDAAPAVAKKLVDALRMSWHPDHARDEPDRVRREERMKQINIAWDLINGRREAA